MKKNSTVEYNRRRLAAICGAVDATLATAQSICDSLSVSWELIDKTAHDTCVKTSATLYHSTDADRLNATLDICASVLNELLDGVASVNRDSYTVATLATASRRWSTAHKQYEYSEENFRKTMLRCVYSEVVGAFKCTEEYDAVIEARHKLADARKFVNGVKGKKNGETVWKQKPAATRISRLKAELAALKKTNDPALAERLSDTEATLKALEKKLKATVIKDFEDALATVTDRYKKAVGAEINAIAIELAGGADLKEHAELDRAKMVLEFVANK